MCPEQNPRVSQRQEWRCTVDGKLLGIRYGHRVHIRIGKRPEYFAELPASAVCHGCGNLNELLPEEPSVATGAAV